MNKKLTAILSAALILTGCAGNKIEISKEPGEFTAATRIEATETQAPFALTTAPTESAPAKQKQVKVNEYGLVDQYFRDSLTNKWNELIAQRNFVSEVRFLEKGDDGKWYFWYEEKNEIKGRDRHQQKLDDPKSLNYSSDIYYLRDTQKHYVAFGLDWDTFTYSVLLDVDADYENNLLDQSMPSRLFYGIDDLETAVYYGYATNSETGITVEKFMMEDVVYEFYYDKNGILVEAQYDGHLAKVKSFETNCPDIMIPASFKFVQ
jgi:hypothetical protein